MTATMEQVTAQALELPLADRAKLAHQLLDSLDETPPPSRDEYRAAWAKEIKRRMEEVENGTAKLISSEEFMKELRAEFP